MKNAALKAELAGLNISVLPQSDIWSAYESDFPALREAAQLAWRLGGGEQFGACEMSLALSVDAQVQELNRTYRGQDKPTNVLSFPSAQEEDEFCEADQSEAPQSETPDSEAGHYLGDVIFAYETIMQECENMARAPLFHLSHLTVHGTLHLLGYDHETPDEAEEMETLERKILSELGFADPYNDDDDNHDEE